MERRDIDYNGWNEDGYPARGVIEEEYIEDEELEDDEYPIGYTPVQGNWCLEDYDNGNSFEKISRHSKIRSVRTYSDTQKKKIQKKRRDKAKDQEEQRQKYYHYNNTEE